MLRGTPAKWGLVLLPSCPCWQGNEFREECNIRNISAGDSRHKFNSLLLKSLTVSASTTNISWKEIWFIAPHPDFL